jgi:hypothetical protein
MNNSKFSFGNSNNQNTDERNNKKNKYEAKFLNSGTKTGLSGISGIKKAVAIGLAAASTITMSGDAGANVYTATNTPAVIDYNGGVYRVVGANFGVANANLSADGSDIFDTAGNNTINFQMNAGNNAEIAEIKNTVAANGVLLVDSGAGGGVTGRLTVKKVTTAGGQTLNFKVNNGATLFLDLTAQIANAGGAGVATPVVINGNADVNILDDDGPSFFRVKGGYSGNANTLTFTKGIDSAAAGDGVLIVDGTGAAAADVGAVIFQGQVGATDAVEIRIGGSHNNPANPDNFDKHAILQFDTNNNNVNTAGVTFYSSDSKLIIERSADVNFVATNGILSYDDNANTNTLGGYGILELSVPTANTLTVVNEIGNGGAGIKGINLIGNNDASKVVFSNSITLGGTGTDGAGAGNTGNAGSDAFLDVTLAKTVLADTKNIYIGGDGGAGNPGGGAGGKGGKGTVKFSYGNAAMEFTLGDNGDTSIFQIGGVGGNSVGANAGGDGGDAKFTLENNALTITGNKAGTKLNFGGTGGDAEVANGGAGGAGGNAILDLSKELKIQKGGAADWAAFLGGNGGSGADGLVAGGNGGAGGAGGKVTITSNDNAAGLTEDNETKFTFGGKGGVGGAAAGGGNNDGGAGGAGGDFEINLLNNLTITLVHADRDFGGLGGNGGNSTGAGAAGAGGKGGEFKITFGNAKVFTIADFVATLGGTGGTGGTDAAGKQNGADGGKALIVGANNNASTLTLVADSIIGGTGGAGANNGNGGAGGIATLQLRGTNAAAGAGNVFTVTRAIQFGGTGGAAHGTGTGGAGGVGVIELINGNASTLTLNAATIIGGKAGAGAGAGTSGAGGAGYLVGSYNDGNPSISGATTHALSVNWGLTFGNLGANNGVAGGNAGAGGEGFVHLGANFTTSANAGSLIIGGTGGAGTGNGVSGAVGGKGTLKISDTAVAIALDGGGETKIGGIGGAGAGAGNGGAGGAGELILANAGTFNKAVTIGGKGGNGGGGGGGATGGVGGAGKITATLGNSSFTAAVTIGGNAGANGNADGGNGEIEVNGAGAVLTFNNALTLGGTKQNAGNDGASILNIKQGTIEIKAALNIKESDDSKITLGNDAVGVTDGILKLTTLADDRDLKEFKGGIEFKSAGSAIQYKSDNAADRAIILPFITTPDANAKGTLEIDANGQDITVTSANKAGADNKEFAIGKIDVADNRLLKLIKITNSNDSSKAVEFKNANADGTIHSAGILIDKGAVAAPNQTTLKFTQGNNANTLTVKGNVTTSNDDFGILELNTNANASAKINFIGDIGANANSLNKLTITTANNANSTVNITGNVFVGANGISINNAGASAGQITFTGNVTSVGNIAIRGAGAADGLVKFEAKGTDTTITGNIVRDNTAYNLIFDTKTNNTITLDGTIDANATSVKITNTGANDGAKTIFTNKSESAVKIGNGATLEIKPGVAMDAANAWAVAINAENAGNGALIINTDANAFKTTVAIGGGNTLKSLSIDGANAATFDLAVSLGGDNAAINIAGTGARTFSNAVTLNGANASVAIDGTGATSFADVLTLTGAGAKLDVKGAANRTFTGAVTLDGANASVAIDGTGATSFADVLTLTGVGAKLDVKGNAARTFTGAVELKGDNAAINIVGNGAREFTGAVTVGGVNNNGTVTIEGTGKTKFDGALTIGNGTGSGKLLVKKGDLELNNTLTLTNNANSGIVIGDSANDASLTITKDNNYTIGGLNTTNTVVLSGTGVTTFAYKLSGHGANAKSLTFGGGAGGIYADAGANSTFTVENDTDNEAGVLTIDGHVGANAKQIKSFVVTGNSADKSIVEIKGNINVGKLHVEKATFKLYNDKTNVDSNIIADSIVAPSGAVEVKGGDIKHTDNANGKQVELGYVDATTPANSVGLDTIRFANTQDRDKDKLNFKNVGTLEYNSDKKLTLSNATFGNLSKINFTTTNGNILINGVNGNSGTIDSLVSTNDTMGNFTIEKVKNLNIEKVGSSGSRFGTFNVYSGSDFTSKTFWVKNVNVATGSVLRADAQGTITNLTMENNSTLDVKTTGYKVDKFEATKDFQFNTAIESVNGNTIDVGNLKINKSASVGGKVIKIVLSDGTGSTKTSMDVFNKISQLSKLGEVAIESATPIFVYESDANINVDAFNKEIAVETATTNSLSAKYDPKTRKITTKIDPGKIEEAAKEQAKEINDAVKNVTEPERQILEAVGINEGKIAALQEFNFTTESDQFKDFGNIFWTNNKSDAGQLGSLLNTIKEGGDNENNQVAKIKIAELVASIDLDQIAEQVTSATTSQIADRVSSALDSSIADNISDSFIGDDSAPSAIEAKYSASGDSSIQRTGLWMKSFLGSGEKKHQVGVSGFTSDIKGITLGVDTTATDRLIVGGAITFAGTNMKMKEGIRDGNKVSTNSKIFSLYGSYALGNNVFLSLIGSYGSNITDVTEDRATVSGFDEGERKDVKSEYGSNMYSLNTKLMYKHVADNLVLTPSVGLNFSRANDESYSEKGIDTAKTYASKSLTRVNLTTGVKAAYVFGNIVPEVHVNLTQKVAGKDPKVGYKLDGFGDFRYSENTKKLAATTYNIGGSINYKTDSVNVGVGVDGNFASRYTGYQGSLNLRINM